MEPTPTTTPVSVTSTISTTSTPASLLPSIIVTSPTTTPTINQSFQYLPPSSSDQSLGHNYSSSFNSSATTGAWINQTLTDLMPLHNSGQTPEYYYSLNPSMAAPVDNQMLLGVTTQQHPQTPPQQLQPPPQHQPIQPQHLQIQPQQMQTLRQQLQAPQQQFPANFTVNTSFSLPSSSRQIHGYDYLTSLHPSTSTGASYLHQNLSGPPSSSSGQPHGYNFPLDPSTGFRLPTFDECKDLMRIFGLTANSEQDPGSQNLAPLVTTSTSVQPTITTTSNVTAQSNNSHYNKFSVVSRQAIANAQQQLHASQQHTTPQQQLQNLQQQLQTPQQQLQNLQQRLQTSQQQAQNIQQQLQTSQQQAQNLQQHMQTNQQQLQTNQQQLQTNQQLQIPQQQLPRNITSTGNQYASLLSAAPTKPRKMKVIPISPLNSASVASASSSFSISAQPRKMKVATLHLPSTSTSSVCTASAPVLHNSYSAILSSVIPSVSPPQPPNWDRHLEDTVLSLSPYKLFPISSNSLEYTTLCMLLNPSKITAAEQVVNPTLWSRFVKTRKDMLLSKSDDLQLLSKLGLDEGDVMKSAHLSLNFTKDAAVAAYPYNDNMALLFHCTRSLESVDNILRQGLDERVGNASGLLGRGIYFADDPNKSMQYDGCGGVIFIFAVLLGDCLSVDHIPNKQTFVKEPDKLTVQKRNFNDFNFDSIFALPTGFSEYVVYNRYQCCPLYKIQYKKSYAAAKNNQNDVYSKFRNKSPPFSWIPGPNVLLQPAKPNQLANTYWPFYAKTIFTEMGPKDEVVVLEQTFEIPSESAINEKLAIIFSLGFNDADLNLETLKKFKYDLESSVNYLLDQAAVSALTDQPSGSKYLENVRVMDVMNQPSGSKSLGTTSVMNVVNQPSGSKSLDTIRMMDSTVSSSTFAEKDTALDEKLLPNISNSAVDSKTTPYMASQNDSCLICCNEYEITSTNWNVLQCSHKLCNACYKQIETTRTTMAGITHTFIKCPFCLGTSKGIEIGTCPNGTMTEMVIPSPCEGYEEYNTISIRYNVFDSNYRLSRTAFLPDNDEGRKVCKLLRKAWDRRLCFSIGTSSTTGKENVLVWNIHHKTAQRGGVRHYGFPDPTYLERVQWELKIYGIES